MQKKITLLDGAMGTMLQKMCKTAYDFPEEINIEESSIVRKIHSLYVEAGAEIITANTFGANRINIKKSKYTLDAVIKAAIDNARFASQGTDVKVALDIGPIGQLLEPMGSLSFDEAYDLFREVVLLGEKYGADLYIIETMTDLNEARAALFAVKENSLKKVFCTMSFEENGRTFTGVCPESMVITLEGLGADAVGVNCSLGPKQLIPIVKRIADTAKGDIIVQPNAGLPHSQDGINVYDIDKEEFAECMMEFIETGVSIVGGCCGTDDEYIKALHTKINDSVCKERSINNLSYVCSGSKAVSLDSVRIIGERINPTGKENFKNALKSGNFDFIAAEAIKQCENGADILDVNVGLPEIDEKEVMVQSVKKIQSVTDVPLQIDSTDKDVIEAALRIYNGKAIVNSVTGEERSMNEILPLVKKYGASFIALALDENGLPQKAMDRVRIIDKIIKRAEDMGIDRNNIFADALVLTASAQQDQVKETLDAVQYINDKLHVKTVLGISNISFGLPHRELLNSTFLSMALARGLKLPMVNPNSSEIMNVIRSFRVLNMEDISAEKYIDYYSDSKMYDCNKKDTLNDGLKDIIIKGLKEDADSKTRELLKDNSELDIVNQYLIPALDIVGERYEKGEIFLPQLISSAETVKKSFEVLKQSMKDKGTSKIIKGNIIMATVKGDVHDIGKNIVKVLLENYGYNVIDLGMDADPDYIADMAVKYDVKLVGLSALMTTTVKNMALTIEKIKEKKQDCKVFVGGAVLNEEYADMIHADYYSKDAKEAVRIAESVLRKH